LDSKDRCYSITGGRRKHYIAVIKNYLIPFFGKMDVANISVKELRDYNDWRDKQIANELWERAVKAAIKKATNGEQLKAAKSLRKKGFKASQSTINESVNLTV
jgi:hypothetical protein